MGSFISRRVVLVAWKAAAAVQMMVDVTSSGKLEAGSPLSTSLQIAIWRSLGPQARIRMQVRGGGFLDSSSTKLLSSFPCIRQY
jgi:hypothetical protein